MKIRSTLAALLGAGLLAFGVAGVAFADGTITWDGSQGLGQDGLPTVQCDADNAAGTVTFILTLGGGTNSVTSATLHLGGSGSGDVTNTPNGNEVHLQAAFSGDFATLTASADYVGTLGSGDVNLTISHYCPGESETAPPTAAPTEVPSQGVGDETNQPSQPSTDSVFGTGSSGPSDTAWLLVVALGVLLASVVVLTPSRAKNKR
jgi:hypothetical protein